MTATATVDRIIARQFDANAADAAQAGDMLAFVDDARRGGEAQGAGSLESSAAVHELSLAVRVPVAVLDGQLSDARRTRSVLPTVWQAWFAGQIGGQQVAAIAAASRVLQQPDSIIELDHTVVPIAMEKTVGQLRAWLRRFTDRLEAGSSQRRHEREHRDRRVNLEPENSGMTWLTALIPATRAACIDQRLNDIAREVGPDDKRTHDQLRADTLCALLTEGTTGKIASSKTNIGVIVPIQSLMGLSDAPGELADRSTSVPASLVRSMALQPETLFWRLLTDERGGLLDVTKMSRHAPADVGMAIRFRDGTSVFPTAAVPANRCDLDHTIAYPAPTSADNLGALHRRAHRLKTAGLLSVRQPEPGEFDWTTSTGHRYRNSPQPFPDPGWDDVPAFDEAFLDAVGDSVEVDGSDDDDAPPASPLDH